MNERVFAWIGMGANLGLPKQALESAFESLAALPGTQLLARSSIWRTAPVDAPGQPDYFNAIAKLETSLAPHALLREIQAIEQAQGRERSFRNAPRTLDLDLLLYGDAIVGLPDLVVPHPRMHERAFVLAPLAEIEPELAIPGVGVVSELLAAVGDQRIERLP